MLVVAVVAQAEVEVVTMPVRRLEEVVERQRPRISLRQQKEHEAEVVLHLNVFPSFSWAQPTWTVQWTFGPSALTRTCPFLCKVLSPVHTLDLRTHIPRRSRNFHLQCHNRIHFQSC